MVLDIHGCPLGGKYLPPLNRFAQLAEASWTRVIVINRKSREGQSGEVLESLRLLTIECGLKSLRLPLFRKGGCQLASPRSQSLTPARETLWVTESPQSTAQRNTWPVMQKPTNKKRKYRSNNRSCYCGPGDRISKRLIWSKRAFHVSYLWNQVTLSTSFFISVVAVCLLLF